MPTFGHEICYDIIRESSASNKNLTRFLDFFDAPLI